MAGFTLSGAPSCSGSSPRGADSQLRICSLQQIQWRQTLGSLDTNTIFSSLSGVCATTNQGDGIVRYDARADRWIISQFAWDSDTAAPWFQCLAVSTSSDPTGSYALYAIDFSSVGFPDFGKWSVYDNGYYFSAIMFSAAGASISNCLCGADRAMMLLGNTSAKTYCSCEWHFCRCLLWLVPRRRRKL